MYIQVSGFEAELIRKKIKNMHLYVLRPDGKIRITAPMNTPESRIRDFFESHIPWILKQHARLDAEPKALPITYSSGDVITIFGSPYTLEVAEGKKNSFSFFLGKAYLTCKPSSTQEEREAIIEKALRASLYEKLPPMFDKWEKITGLYSSSFQIKKMKTRWGTCNTRTKKIWLNLELAKKSDECIEYVILHELAHLKVPNHGKDFAYIMDKYMPNWRKIREFLNQR